MAQYYQVLSQTDKTATQNANANVNIAEYYPNLNLIQNPTTIQYIVSSDDQHRLLQQNQQILVQSGEQLMLVNNRPQQIIVRSAQVAYQAPIAGQQFVLQDAQQQQGFPLAMESVSQLDKPQQQGTEQVVQRQQLQQPIVLNHRMPQQAVDTEAENQVKQNRNPGNVAVMRPQSNTGFIQLVPRAATPQQSKQIQQPLRQPLQRSLHQSHTEGNGVVSLADGTVVSLNDYKKMVLGQQQNVGNLERNNRNKTAVSRNTQETNVQKPLTLQQQRFAAHQQLREMEMQERMKQRLMQPPQTQMQHPMRMQPPKKPPPAQASRQQPSLAAQPAYVVQAEAGQSQEQQQTPTYPAFVPSSQIQQIIENTPVNDDCPGSIRMLVLLEDGEQRLITFTLPKEACTVLEILEQVGVNVKPETTIGVQEYTGGGLNYVVTVGQPPLCFQGSELIPASGENSAGVPSISSTTGDFFITPPPEASQTGSGGTDIEKDLPKLVPGKLAVCMHCGYLSEDFNKCLRCKRKLPEDIKSVPATTTMTKGGELQRGHEKKAAGMAAGIGPKISQKQLLNNGSASIKKKPKPKLPDAEPVVLTLSSDDEDDHKKTNSTEHLIQKLAESSVTISMVRKEPSILDIQRNISSVGGDNDPIKGDCKDDDIMKMCISIPCRTMRVGSYKFVSPEPLLVDYNTIIFHAPHLNDQKNIRPVIIDRQRIAKVLVSFHKSLPVLFYYVTHQEAAAVRSTLGMTNTSDYYFDPLAREESYKRITVFPEYLSEDVRTCLKQIYEKPVNIMDELTQKEANNILLRTCPKDVQSIIPATSFSNIRELLIYPPGKGGLTIHKEDYLCLGRNQFLNDVIIDFYLKYLVLNLPKDTAEKVHVFSTFFYKRLTTKPVKPTRRSHPTELDPLLTPAQKRHSRVKSWTKNVNLFEKDFIIIPINKNAHWFLAIICFPNLNGAVTLDGVPTKQEVEERKKKINITNIGNVSITVKVEDKSIKEELELSDRDETDVDESELESESESLDEPVQEETSQRQPIKQPCILIFDSLAGASRSRVVATLRDYLTCEYKAKMGKEKIFNKDVIKGASPKVPQQNNFDCGLYVLQYVEQFFKDPIKDYHIPIKHLKDWFEEITVTKKREDISKLIKQLMREQNRDTNILPEICLPTADGKVIDSAQFDEDDQEGGGEDEEMLEEGEIPPGFIEITGAISSENGVENKQFNDSSISSISDTVPPSSQESNESSASGKFTLNLADANKQSNRDTMSYLKAKRIIRHKHVEAIETKRLKSD